jgi:deoxyribodipyrimidine photolyase-related protein
MKSITILFPHQLFLPNPAVNKEVEIYLVEEYLFFRQYKFHQQKIVFHRASMKSYEASLIKEGYIVNYIDSQNELSDIRLLIPALAKDSIKTIHYIDTVDHWLEKRIQAAAAANDIKLIPYPSPDFLNTVEDTNEFFAQKKTYFQTDFYIWQRKKRNLLLDEKGKPAGGKWTFDAENRLRFPKNELAPALAIPAEDKFVKEAKAYTVNFFSGNYGTTDTFIYPINHTAASEWLDNFLATRFSKFGIYEDAMVKKESVLYHSVLTPMLNTGLLTPQQVIDRTLIATDKFDIPINSLEGFIRQITGWREFIRIVYEKEGSKQRTTNYWVFTRKIPPSFWNGTTGIHPIDSVIKKILRTGYSHHIERLMVLGNFMLLCEFDPDEVYRWFMEMYIDSYDWVMVPNVYGMTQFADGGLMTTKPYISGSNYLLKMGDWDKGDWQQIWDGLFWRFMHVHRDFFSKNPRLGMLLNTFDKMPTEKRNNHLTAAENYLASLNK